jgi:AcrR family transcriptional regulator
VSPRPYDLGRRRGLIDETRRSVIDAARGLLADASTYTAFTVDAVAKRADVARATVYYQFGSKTGLLEALCDSLAEAGHLAELPEVFDDPDAWRALGGIVTVFGRFWSSDRLVTRRLRALARLDPEVAAVIDARDEGRRTGLGVIVDRIAGDRGMSNVVRDELVRTLYTLSSFETFDSLAGSEHDPSDVSPIIIELAHAAIQRSRPRTANRGDRRTRASR